MTSQHLAMHHHHHGNQNPHHSEYHRAINTFTSMHAQRAVDQQHPITIEPASGVANNDGDAQCASHASGVEACREQGEAPQGSQAGRVDGANSIGSGVAGPYNPPSPAGEQPSEVSKPRHYKHHSSAAATTKPTQRRPATKRPHVDKQEGQPHATRHHATTTAQPAHASNGGIGAPPPLMHQQQQQQPTPIVQPPMPNVDMPPMGPYQPAAAAAYMGHPMMLMQDPKFWQAVQAGIMPPPPMPPFFAMGSPWQLVNMLAGQQMLSAAAAASTWGGPAPSNQSLAPTTTYAGAPNKGPMGMPGEHHHHAGVHQQQQQPSAMAQTCKEQVRQMAAAGLPSEVQIEAAARSKAAELGEPALAQMLMAWYYAGFFTGQQPQQGQGGGG